MEKVAFTQGRKEVRDRLERPDHPHLDTGRIAEPEADDQQRQRPLGLGIGRGIAEPEPVHRGDDRWRSTEQRIEQDLLIVAKAAGAAHGGLIAAKKAQKAQNESDFGQREFANLTQKTMQREASFADLITQREDGRRGVHGPTLCLLRLLAAKKS